MIFLGLGLWEYLSSLLLSVLLLRLLTFTRKTGVINTLSVLNVLIDIQTEDVVISEMQNVIAITIAKKGAKNEAGKNC